MGFVPRKASLTGNGEDMDVKIGFSRLLLTFAFRMATRKILILTNRIPWPLHDGGALGMDFMIRGYQKAGVQVYLLAMNTTRHSVSAEKLPSLYKDLHGFDTVPVNNNLKPGKIVSNLVFSRDPEHVSRFYTPKFETKVREIIASFQPDAIQVESPFLSAYIPAIRNLTKAILILRVNNVEYQIWERLAAESKGIKRVYFKNLSKRIKRYEEKIWADYDVLLPVTQEDANVIAELKFSNRIVLAPFGIDLSSQQIHEPANLLNTYHVGAMDWMPNVDAMEWMLEDWWPAANNVLANTKFHFAGRHMPSKFRENLPGNAYCHGEVASVEKFIKDKGTLIVPLRAGGGIRVKILEAMASGKLVISTDIGMQGIDATDKVHFLKANNAKEFVAVLKWLSTNKQAAIEMTQAAAKLVAAQYSMKTIIGNIISEVW